MWVCRLCHCIYTDAEQALSELVLIDVDKARAEGEAMDISHGMPFAAPMKIYAGSYDDIVDADIINHYGGERTRNREKQRLEAGKEKIDKPTLLKSKLIPENCLTGKVIGGHCYSS